MRSPKAGSKTPALAVGLHRTAEGSQAGAKQGHHLLKVRLSHVHPACSCPWASTATLSCEGKELPWHPAQSRAGGLLCLQLLKELCLRLWGILLCSPHLPNTGRSPLGHCSTPPSCTHPRLDQQQRRHRGGMNWDEQLA